MDEVAALEGRQQGALLRVLEQGAFFRAGGTQKVAMNARIITATNRDIDASWNAANSAATCSIASTPFDSRCRRCATAGATSRSSPSTSCRAIPRDR